MSEKIYRKLAKHMDQLPSGYPPGPNDEHIRVLELLFTPEEAELATKCSVIPEEARVIARRAGLSVDEARRRLDAMSDKGLIFSYTYKGATHYMAGQFAIGVWEWHLGQLTPELVAAVDAYMPYYTTAQRWQQAPQLRTIPVGRSIPAGAEILDYERAEELVAQQKKILVAPCICRKERAMAGQPCDRPEETCLVFGMGVDYYQKNGLGRVIDQAEALEILKKADQAGLVLQPTHAQKIMNICCCCGCCCRVLEGLKKHPAPAEAVSSPFVAAADPETCEACGVCEDRCQMGAISYDAEDKVVLAAERCIGCGLCVSTCPSGSLTLVRKPAEQQRAVPSNNLENLMAMARARGKMGPASMAGLALKSKLDRLLASKE